MTLPPRLEQRDDKGSALPAEHTPGPWAVSRPIAVCDPRYLHIRGPKVADGVVAKVMAKRAGDAHLIAAAPELRYVAVLVTELAAVLGENNAVVQLARAALQKAKGQP